MAISVLTTWVKSDHGRRQAAERVRQLPAQLDESNLDPVRWRILQVSVESTCRQLGSEVGGQMSEVGS